MENKQSKRRWKIPVLLVSAICILLASSFVFHTTAEAAVLSYGLYGATFTSPVYNDGTSAGAGIDTSLITDYSITSSSQYVSNDMYDTGTLQAYLATPVYVAQMPDCKYAEMNKGIVTLYKTNGTETVDVGSQVPTCFIPGYYVKSENYAFGIYSFDGELLYQKSTGSAYSFTLQGFFFVNSYYFVVASNKNGVFVYPFSDSFAALGTYTLSTLNNNYALCCALYGDEILCGANGSKLFSFDTESFQTSVYDFSSLSIKFFNTALIFDGDSLLLFSSGGYYLLDLSAVSAVQYSYPISFQSNYPRAWFCIDSIFVSGSSSTLKLQKSNSFYNDFGIYAANYIQNAKYVNFSVKSSTSVNGGDMVGIKLDYNLPSEYLSTVGAYGLRLTGCTMLASIDDSSAGIPNFGFSPIVVKVNGSAIPRYSTSYDLIGEHNGIYLYSFISSIDFQGYTRITSLEIYLNCYIPEQLSKHSFSLPVSPVELYLDPAGGGGGGGESSGGGSSGGESSGGGSSGGESSGTPSVDPGESSDDVPGENDPAFLKIYKVSSGGTLSYIRYFPTARLSKVSVFFGSLPSFEYSQKGIYAISPSSSFLVLEYADSGQRIINLDFYAQGWSKSPSLSSMHYPLFSGNVIEIDFTNTYSIYLADVVPYGQIRICDYDNTMFSLVNLPAPDSVVNISQYSDNKFQVSCQGSVRYYPGKIARYKEYGFGSTSSWELYEEGSILQFSRLGSPLLNTVQLQTYTGEFPPHDPDYEEQIRIEESIRAELESRANELYGSVSFDPQDESDFDEAKQDVRDVLSSGSVIFNFINKLWNTNPFTSHFVVITATCAILAFVVRKL